MTSRRDVDLLARAGREAVKLAQTDLDAFWAQFNGLGPERFRDALLEFVPDLVRTYGSIASTAAAEWYEQVRTREYATGYRALAPSLNLDAAAQGTVRAAAGDLFTDTPDNARAMISTTLQRYVLGSSRNTVTENIRRDPAKPRFGRIPTGAKTCAFCSLMASRGFVYVSQASAGMRDEFHNDCDCQIVSEWDHDQHHIDGYNPDHLYGLYQSARNATGSSDPKVILAKMRRMHPDSFTDGVVSDH